MPRKLIGTAALAVILAPLTAVAAVGAEQESGRRSMPIPDESQVELTIEHEGDTYKLIHGDLYKVADSPERLAVIRKMLAMLSHDAPSVFKAHPVSYSLFHGWLYNAMPDFRTAKIKYLRLDPVMRKAYRDKYNEPQWGKLVVFVVAVIVFATPAVLIGITRLRGT